MDVRSEDEMTEVEEMVALKWYFYWRDWDKWRSMEESRPSKSNWILRRVPATYQTLVELMVKAEVMVVAQAEISRGGQDACDRCGDGSGGCVDNEAMWSICGGVNKCGGHIRD